MSESNQKVVKWITRPWLFEEPSECETIEIHSKSFCIGSDCAVHHSSIRWHIAPPLALRRVPNLCCPFRCVQMTRQTSIPADLFWHVHGSQKW
jgi:hypothetical protein